MVSSLAILERMARRERERETVRHVLKVDKVDEVVGEPETPAETPDALAGLSADALEHYFERMGIGDELEMDEEAAHAVALAEARMVDAGVPREDWPTIHLSLIHI